MTAFSSADAPAATPAQRAEKSRTVRILLLVVLLTVTYLTFELAFNARLLDVVGGNASQDDVHRIEISGRLLSGCAAALVLLQIMLSARKSWLAIVGACGLTIAVVYMALQMFVNFLVNDFSTLEFRRQALNVTLIQQSLVEGRVELAGLNQDPDLYSRPEGKAFLAMFALMATSVEDLDRKISDAKIQLLSEHIGKQVGGIQGYFDSYRQAIDQVTQQWKNYRKLDAAHVDIDAEVDKRHQRAWNQYLNDLGKQGWTPSSVPAAYHERVRRNVRKKGAPVSSHWALNDEAGFRAAIASQVRRKVSGKKPEVRIRGQVIPPGLSFPAFVQHPALQAELRDTLKLPSTVRVPHEVDKPQFVTLFNAMRTSQATQEARKYNAPLDTFGPGGKNFELGLDAARAAIVPPVALFFSMLGALGHMAKLSYILAKLLRSVLRPARRYVVKDAAHRATWGDKLRAWVPHDPLLLIPAALLVSAWLWLSQLHTPVTQSPLYATLAQDTLTRFAPGHAADDAPRWSLGHALVQTLHVVSVGQSFAYPYNERMRTEVLRGIRFGYQPDTPTCKAPCP